MKNWIIYTVLIAGTSIFLSCEKKPDAYFTTNRTTFIAGDTVQLINTSPTGSKFEWELPNGATSTEENPSYIIDQNAGFSDLSFKLTVSSKGRKKTSSTQNSVHVIPVSTFTFFNASYSTTTTGRINRYQYSQSSFAELTAYNNKTFPGGAYEYNTMYMRFADLSAGTYSVVQSFTFNPNTCSLQFQSYTQSGSTSAYFDQGNVKVENLNEAIHITFTNLNYSFYGHKISGDLYYVPEM
jgi:hypothetical protein